METDFLPLLLASPSGAGKTTLKRMLLLRFPDLRFSVSHTTRKPRAEEKDGVDYHFVERRSFEALVRENAFLEWAEVHGNLYGTSLAEIERARATPGCTGMVFDVDYQGARQMRARRSDIVAVFILPPSMTELERRLRGRGTETEETVKRRFEIAKTEIEHYPLFDYLVVNDDLDRAAEQLTGIVLAERARRERRAMLAEALLRTGETKEREA